MWSVLLSPRKFSKYPSALFVVIASINRLLRLFTVLDIVTAPRLFFGLLKGAVTGRVRINNHAGYQSLAG